MPRVHAGERWGRVPVKCFGRYWLLRDVPASTWMEATRTPELAGIFPGLVDNEDAEQIYRLWWTEPDMATRCTRIARRALERAGNGEYQWTLNMIAEIRGSWTHLNGMLVRQGVRADSENLANYLDAAYTLMLQQLNDDGVKAMEARLRKISGTGPVSRPAMSTRADLLAFAKD